VAAVVHRGRILGLVPKEELPTYSVFYERRTFSRGAAGFRTIARGVPLGDYIFAFDAFTLAVEVCEDGWSPDGPMRRRSYSGADVVANISSSPFRVGVQNTRREMLATRSADNQVTLAYATRVGGQDGLVFDGGGFVFQNGRLVVEAPRFRKHMTTSVVDLHRTSRLRLENTTWRTDWEHFRDSAPFVSTISATAPSADRSKLRYPAPVGGSFFLPPATPQAESPGSTRDDTLDELFEAVALGLKDYAAKTPVFRPSASHSPAVATRCSHCSSLGARGNCWPRMEMVATALRPTGRLARFICRVGTRAPHLMLRPCRFARTSDSPCTRRASTTRSIGKRARRPTCSRIERRAP
jgi:NAD+ synthase (glutamine-hydrolysing)